MTLIRWNRGFPVSPELEAFHDEVNRLFDGFMTRPAEAALGFVPATDIEETAEAFVLRLDLPGVAQKDVKVSLLGDTISIRGERRTEAAPASGTLFRRERRSGTFERSFKLDRAVKADQVLASYRDGVLEVRVPKADEARVREIQIQVAS